MGTRLNHARDLLSQDKRAICRYFNLRYRFPAINMAKSLSYFSCYKKVITLGENRAQEQHKPRRCLSVY